MPKLRELIPNYEELLDQGLGKDELITLAQKRVASYVPPVSEEVQAPQEPSPMQIVKKIAPKPMQEHPSTPQNAMMDVHTLEDATIQNAPLLNNEEAAKRAMNADGNTEGVMRGLAKNYIRTNEMLDFLGENATPAGIVSKFVPESMKEYFTPPKTSQKLINLGEQLDDVKEKLVDAKVTPERKAQRDALKQESQNAQGAWDNVKVGVKQMVDTAIHPSEWTPQGITETASDITNPITLGVGKAASMVFKTPLLKFIGAGGAGMVENGIMAGATEYAVARGAGKSEEEARKIALQSMAGGAAIGAPLGMAGSMLPSGIGKPKEIDPNVSEVDGFYAKAKGNNPNGGDGGSGGGGALDAAFGNLGENDTIFNFVESEIVAQKNDEKVAHVVDNMVAQGVEDPAALRAIIEQNIVVSEADKTITLAINDGVELPKAYTGSNLALKVAKTIEAGMQSAGEVHAKLKSIGASDELATVAAQAVEAKNPDIFHAWWAKKLEPMMQQKTPPSTVKLDKTQESIRANDVGGDAQAEAYKAQMQAWADAANLRRVNQGLEPNVTAEDMAKSFDIRYEDGVHVNDAGEKVGEPKGSDESPAIANDIKPNPTEIAVLLDTVSDTDGKIKNLRQRNASHGWQDVTALDAYGNPYTRRMAGERGLDSEITAPVGVLKKLKEEGYEALSPDERIMVDRDLDTIRNHPDFRQEPKDEDGVHVNEAGELVDADGNYLFQAVREKDEAFKEFKQKALDGNQDETFDFGIVSENAAKKIEDITGLNLRGYKREIEAKYIRHIKNRHPEDLAHLDNLSDMFENFDFAEKSITRNEQTGKPEVSLVLYRKVDDGVVKAVELRNFSETTLSLKTIFKMDMADQKLPQALRLSPSARDTSSFSSRPNPHSDGFNGDSIAQKAYDLIKGSYNIREKLITILKGHDPSTLNHELGHHFLYTLDAKERAVAEGIFGVKDGKWEVEHHEAFANAYARYIAEGKVTSSGLKAIFEKFRAFTLKVLSNLVENNGGKMPELSPKMQAFFDATMGDAKARSKMLGQEAPKSAPKPSIKMRKKPKTKAQVAEVTKKFDDTTKNMMEC